MLGYLNSLGDLLCPVAVEGDAVFYRTAWHPDGCPPRTPPETSPGVYTLDIGSPGDEAFIGWGWHYRRGHFRRHPPLGGSVSADAGLRRFAPGRVQPYAVGAGILGNPAA